MKKKACSKVLTEPFFNLEKALLGEPIVTRDGRPVSQLRQFNLSPRLSVLHGVLDGFVEVFNLDGQQKGGFHELDLFMKVKERWVNVYASNADRSAYAAGEYPSKESARANPNSDDN
jgi:hypothetical protein